MAMDPIHTYLDAKHQAEAGLARVRQHRDLIQMVNVVLQRHPLHLAVEGVSPPTEPADTTAAHLTPTEWPSAEQLGHDIMAAQAAVARAALAYEAVPLADRCRLTPPPAL